jgi:hypothetical protein
LLRPVKDIGSMDILFTVTKSFLIISLPKRKAAFIEPMDCAPVTKLLDGPGWVYEIKLECLCFYDHCPPTCLGPLVGGTGPSV